MERLNSWVNIIEALTLTTTDQHTPHNPQIRP